jgi:hypothetical protein
MADQIFRNYADEYRAAGYWPRPIKPGSKACKISNWQIPDSEQSTSTLRAWTQKFAYHGIGLLMASPFPDGTKLGAFDIDRNEYLNLGRTLLGNPVCGRIGAKGAVFFVRVRGELGNPEFRVTGLENKSWGKVAECLFNKKICVIPPTIHPTTGAAYQWIGAALLEINFEQLPIIEA